MTEPLSIASTIFAAATRLESVSDNLLVEAQQFGEYHTGSSLLACYSKIELCREKLLMWRDLWDVKDPSNDSRLEIVWSQTAIASVRNVVGRISEVLSKLEDSNSRLRSSSATKLQKSRLNRWLKWRKKAALKNLADTQSATDVVNYAIQLDELSDELLAVSEMSFRSKQFQDIQRPPRNQPAAEDSTFLREVQAMKRPLQTVFRQSTLTHLDLSLELDLFQAERQTMCLHLFVNLEASNSTIQELMIGFDVVQTQTLDESFLADSDSADTGEFILHALTSTNPQVLRATTVGPDKSLILRIQNVSKPNSASIAVKSFSSSLESVPIADSIVLSKDSRMSLVNKIRLAFKIVECGLWLFGTPWLSNLRSENLLELTSKDQVNPVYVLPGISIDFHDIEDEMLHWLSSTGQVSSIGTLLIEIALETPSSISPRLRSFDLESSLAKKITEVEKCMGLRYGRAVDFCFRNAQTRTNSWRIMSIEDDDDDEPEQISPLLEDYYLNVYTV